MPDPVVSHGLLLALCASQAVCVARATGAGEGSAAIADPPTSRCPAALALVPGGTYKLGEGGDEATVRAFCLDVVEVTADAYAACVGCTPPGSGFACNGGVPGHGNHPVNCVDLAQATAYCAALGKRLPSEQEWEWAARGADRGTTYPWGNEPPGARACWDGKGNEAGLGRRWAGGTGTCAVGTHPAGSSPQGIQDLAGNVLELVASDDRSVPIGRGGAWHLADAAYCTAQRRFSLPPGYRGHEVGFRCAAVAKL
jgi:sulfatase modifying factor 1